MINSCTENYWLDDDSTGCYIYTTSSEKYIWQYNITQTQSYRYNKKTLTYDKYYNNKVWANAKYSKNVNISWYTTGEDTPVQLDLLKPAPVSVTDRLQLIIATRTAPTIMKGRRSHYMMAMPDNREMRARETLKLIVGDDAYRRYLKDGFVSVKNHDSGRVYQIFPGHGFTKVYEKGKLIETLCVVLRSGITVGDNFTPTDHLIVRYLLALNDEKRLWALANKHGAFKPIIVPVKPIDTRPLNVIMHEFRMRKQPSAITQQEFESFVDCGTSYLQMVG